VRPGSHAASDGSFGRSAGIQFGRAIALIAVAVLLGLFLLHRSGPSGSGGGGPALASATSTTQPTTSSTAPPLSSSTSSSVAIKAPPNVKVLVANGSNINGLAGRLRSRLSTQGYATVGTGNASQAATSSKIYYQPGFASEAAVMAQFLKLAPSAAQPMPNPLPVKDLAGANIVVDAGPDLGSGGTGTSGGPATTTGHTSSTTHVTG
jgi:hypothetical protein